MTTPRLVRNPALNGFLVGAIGFSLGGLVGLLSLLLIRWLGVGAWIAGWLPEEQVLARLLARLLLLLFFLALSGVAVGAFGGLALTYIDPDAPRRRYIGSSALVYALHGFLLAGFILLTALVATVNNANDLDLTRFLSLFGVYGMIYGLVIGLLQGLFTVGWRYFWRVGLAAVIGYTLGGVLLGYLLWQAAQGRDQGVIRNPWLLGMAVFLAIFAVGGGALGLAYQSIATQRRYGGFVPGRISRGWAIVGIIVAAILAYGAIRLGIQLYGFVTVKEGSLSSQIVLPTTGVNWSEAELLSRSSPASDESIALAGGHAGQVAGVWVSASTARGDIILSEGALDSVSHTVDWGTELNVSDTPSFESSQPAITATPDGTWLVVWREAPDPENPDNPSEILYRECQANICSEATKLSGEQPPECANQGYQNQAPVITVDEQGTRMVVWINEYDNLIYTTWSAGAPPPEEPTGCILALEASEPLSLAAGSTEQFELAFSGPVSGQVLRSSFSSGAWQSIAQPVGDGSAPVLVQDLTDSVHLAWCSPQQALIYRPPGGEQIRIDQPACQGSPTLAVDDHNRIHVIWYTDQLDQKAGQPVEGSFLVESILIDGVFSPPAIAARPAQTIQPEAANDRGGNIYLAWNEEQDGLAEIFQAVQPVYTCSQPPATAIGQAVLNTIQAGNFYPAGSLIPYCGNRFDRLLFAPGPVPGSQIPDTPNGAYDRVDQLVASMQYELLFTTMEYQPDENKDSPGFLLGDAVVDLYNQLAANPENYPRGLTVRILLGNYPNLSTLEYGDQIYHVMEDLHKAGLPEMTNEALGWKVEVANFDGQYPHGHTKFIVVDGKTVVAQGYNYSYLHYSTDHVSGKGESLVDFGLQITGPVAQQTLAVFDDLWSGSSQLSCGTLNPFLGWWELACDWTTASVSHPPEVLKFFLPEEDPSAGLQDTAYSLFRSTKFKESDQAVVDAIGSARESIDFFEVNFSLEMQCMLNLIDPDLCGIEQALSYMEAILNALEENPVKVRVLVTDVNSNGLENFIAADVLMEELGKRGLSELVEMRYWPERMHSKAILIDGQLLIVGSQNMHYSSFGKRALTEYNLATENQDAIDTFKQTFEYYWERSLPIEPGSKPNTAQ